ncbi:hypothetical protein D9M71_755520 [compost metagenome]
MKVATLAGLKVTLVLRAHHRVVLGLDDVINARHHIAKRHRCGGGVEGDVTSGAMLAHRQERLQVRHVITRTKARIGDAHITAQVDVQHGAKILVPGAHAADPAHDRRH